MNILTLVGRVGQDPKVGNSVNGKNYARFSVAIKKGFGDGTDWFNVTFWGKQAEIISKYVKKGDNISVSGSVSINEYNGNHSLAVNGEKFTLLGTKNSADSTRGDQDEGDLF